ncbi:twin-arginine translocase TatA/TatE family subunit [Kytococcus sp. Marseille-QA3725]
MNIFGMSQWELLVIGAVVLLLIGPDRLPGALENLRRWIRQVRDMANQAKGDLREQVGDDVDLDWRKWDPRQYNPRRIVREALMEEVTPLKEELDPLRKELNPLASDDDSPATARAGVAESSGGSAAPAAGRPARRRAGPREYDPLAPTPFDADAT